MLARSPVGGILSAAMLCLLVSNTVADAQTRIEAVAGEPFGVASVTIPASPRAAEALERNEPRIHDDGHRASYPTFGDGPLRRLFGDLLGGDVAADRLTVYFLFRGDEPFEVTVYAPDPVRVTIRPNRRPPRRLHDRLLTRWWRQYNADVRAQVNEGDYPPIVETYLTSMLSRRLGLEPPLLSRLAEEQPGEPLKTLELLMGLESLRLDTLRDSMRGTGSPYASPADLPVPIDVAWPPPVDVEFDPDIEIEPIAMRIPEECFYVRFGSFANYLWMSKLLEEYGGDVSGMITLRGYDPRLTARMQQQLALEQNLASELFGDQVIGDVALLGRDLYLREGAALGILFQARNTAVLKLNLEGTRRSFLQRFQDRGAKMETVSIAGQDVSFLSTPDNRLRSYHAIDGDWHLVTTSREVARRFLEVGSGAARALGATAQFKHARTMMPVSREDTIFVYFSSTFLRGLVSPQYQVELARRMQAITDIELLLLARLTARAEGLADETIEQLVAASLLPRDFGQRADRSGPITGPDGEVFDSMRGRRGSFKPIPDVEMKGVTSDEATEYARRAAFYGRQWNQMDPLMIGVKRFALDKEGLERVVVDAHVSPFGEEKYGWIMSMVGAPSTEMICPAPGDIVTAQAMLRGGLLSPSVPPHHVFLGIQDTAPLTTERPTGLLETFRLLRTTPGYLGAWPKPGFLDWLPFGLAGEPDAEGYSRLPLGLVRRQFDGFSVLSFDPDVLARVTPHLQPVPTDDPAQIRVHVGDVSNSKLSVWVRDLTYQRARQASVGDVRLLNTLTQQLNVAREEARSTAERLLDARLVCSLGGEFELTAREEGDRRWVSDQWSRPSTEYDSPLLRWFRGLDAGLTKYGDRLVLHGSIDIQRKPSEPAVRLPFFDLLGGGGKKK